VASAWTGAGGSAKESIGEEKSLFWLLHMDTSIGRVYSIASYKISYFVATSIYDNFIY
jgi:hypothetical protein